MRTFITKSKSDFDLALQLFNGSEVTDLTLDHVCYHLQQAIEKLIKALIEQTGVGIYGDLATSNTAILLATAIERGIDIPHGLIGYSGTLKRWVNESRYPGSFRVSRGEIEDVINYYTQLEKQLK